MKMAMVTYASWIVRIHGIANEFKAYSKNVRIKQ